MFNFQCPTYFFIMPAQPFNPAGFSAKLAELYALSDSALEVQADSIQSDLRSWVTSNFTLTTAQSSYLTGIDDRWIDYNANLISFAVANRLGGSLTQSGDPSGLKLIHTHNTIVVTSSGTSFSVSGTFTIEVIYTS